MAIAANSQTRGSTQPIQARGSAQRILFLVSAHNGLSQRAWIALRELGHEVAVATVDSASAMEAAVDEHRPDLIVCPFLKRMIPESLWSTHRCLIVHPGPVGDRGPSSLDWAIELGMRAWGVTVLEANGEFDAGKVWATQDFEFRATGKSSLYRHEVRRAATGALLEAVSLIAGGTETPTCPSRGGCTHERPATRSHARPPMGQARPLMGQAHPPMGQERPLMGQDVRAIDWRRDCTETVLRKIRAGEGHPGVLDEIGGVEFFLFGAHPERLLTGRPREVIASREQAICRATPDGAVWITHLKRADTDAKRFFKLPAARALALAGIELAVPEVAVALTERLSSEDTFREISYHERAGVGYLAFEFYNGAMSTDHCIRLRKALAYARSRPTRVIVLTGGADYFSNGIHLNVIEAADDPGVESWRNLNAIDDLVRDIIETDSHLVISALRGDAAAGGVPLALAADVVIANEDVVLNPYYQHMGGLYGSEYWTYLLPGRVGSEMTARLTGAPFTPIGAHEALRIGLLDDVFGANVDVFESGAQRLAEGLAGAPDLARRLERKRARRAHDEQIKPIEAYRSEELARSHSCFFSTGSGYHEARRRFVHKLSGVEPEVVPAAERIGRPAERLRRAARAA